MNQTSNQYNVFPVGYHSFHKKRVFNFQFNRGYSLGFTRFEDIEKVGEKIHNFDDWKNEMVKLAEKALSENCLLKGMIGFMNKMAMQKAKADNVQGWMIRQLMYITQKDNPMEAFEVWLAMNEENIHSEKITQDILILSGSDDHFIPIRMHQKQIEAMVNASSVTDRIFTKKEHA